MKKLKKKILVAGGTGLLGSEITRILSKKKNIILLSSFYKKKPGDILKKKYKKFNFLDFRDCLKATKKQDTVFICCVKSGGVKYLKNNPIRNLIENIKLRSNLFEACLVNKVKKVVWVSSSTVYQPSKQPLEEKNLNLNLCPYDEYLITGNSYRFLESIVKFYLKKNLNISIIRTTSIYGPRDNFDNETSHVVPALMKKIIKTKKNFIDVWGSPKVVRDFVYVNDLARACIQISKRSKTHVINFSSGKSTNIETLIKLLIKICNVKLNYKFNFELSSANYRVLNNKLFDKLFPNFKRTDLKNGLKKTLDWYLNEK
jgi:GDP-L-fucose synthase